MCAMEQLGNLLVTLNELGLRTWSQSINDSEFLWLGTVIEKLSYGQYIAAASEVLCCSGDDVRGCQSEILSKAQSLCQPQSSGLSHESIRSLIAGLCCLLGFIQANWTGPFSSKTSSNSDTSGFEELCLDGELIPSHTQLPDLLLASRLLLLLPHELNSSKHIHQWWKMRYLFTHQRILPNPVPSLFGPLSDMLDLSCFPWGPSEWSSQMLLEGAVIHHYYRQHAEGSNVFVLESESVDKLLEKTSTELGLHVELTGVLERRLKYQEKMTSQLALLVDYKENKQPRAECGEFLSTTDCDAEIRELLSESLLPPESDLLDRCYDTPSTSYKRNMQVLEQALLLTLSEDRSMREGQNELRDEARMCFVQRVVEESKISCNWVVRCYGMLLKSRLEEKSSRTCQRSLMQLEALYTVYSNQRVPPQSRVPGFFLVMYPSFDSLRTEYALRLAKFGMSKSALELFVQAEMWEEAISCYRSLDMINTAIDLCRQRLEAKKTSTLVCLLGELTDNPMHFEEAWELSECRFAQAKRLLGQYHFRNKAYAECIRHFELALAINPLFPSCHFAVGCAAMRIENMKLALQAFQRSVGLFPESSEAWGNIGAILFRREQFAEAQLAFSQAVKYDSRNWKLWQNILLVGMRMANWNLALRAWEQLEVLGSSPDYPALGLVVSGIYGESVHSEKDGCSQRLYLRLEKVLDSAAQSGQPAALTLAADYYEARKLNDRAFDLRLAACSALTCHGRVEAWQDTVEAHKALAELAIELGTQKALASSRIKIRNLFSLAASENSEEVNSLVGLLDVICQKEEQKIYELEV